MAARVEIQEALLSRAELESLLALTQRCEDICVANQKKLQLDTQNKKASDQQKEFNDIIFVLQTIEEIEHKTNFQYLLKIKQENIEAHLESDLKKLYERENHYKELNNIRMYEEAQHALQEKLLAEYPKVIKELNQIKGILTEKLNELNSKIDLVSNALKDTYNKSEKVNQNILSDIIANHSHVGELDFEGQKVHYNVTDIAGRIKSKSAGKFADGSMTQEALDQLSNSESESHVRELLNIHNITSVTEGMLNKAIKQVQTAMHDLIHKNPSSNRLTELLNNGIDLSAQMNHLIGLKEVVKSKLNIVENTLKQVLDAGKQAFRNDAKPEELREISIAINSARNLIEDTPTMIQAISEIKIPFNVTNFNMEADEENFDLDADNLAGLQNAAPNFNIDADDDEFNIDGAAAEFDADVESPAYDEEKRDENPGDDEFPAPADNGYNPDPINGRSPPSYQEPQNGGNISPPNDAPIQAQQQGVAGNLDEKKEHKGSSSSSIAGLLNIPKEALVRQVPIGNEPAAEKKAQPAPQENKQANSPVSANDQRDETPQPQRPRR
jgi:hypothetical protein